MALGLAIGANQANASTVGGHIDPEFNYVGLNVSAAGSEVDSLVLEPPADPIGIHGTYTDTAGNFNVPKTGGLEFPPVSVAISSATIDGEIGLTEDGTGNYNEATGAMSMNLKLSLTLGVDDVAVLADELDIPLPGSGALACKLAPLDVQFSTANGWPHEGSAFTNKAGLEDGALAGAWRYKPTISTVEGDPTLCGIIGGFLGDVGGIWLGNDSTESLTDMPIATGPKPPKYECAEDGLEGTPPNCTEPVEQVCDEGYEGTFPDCTKILTPAKAVVSITKKATVKAGKKVKIKVTVKNTGEKALTGKLVLSSNNKKVTASPKKISVNVAGGRSVTKTITVKASKKAKGKATISAKLSGKTAKSTVKVKAAKKKKKRKH
jgi:hypothetical protein